MLLNPEQLEFVRRVAARVVEEESTGEAENLNSGALTEPLRWALHGGPGAGKSHVLRLIRTELFDGILQWQQGIQYKVVALQAVMAEQLEGDTIHHAVGPNKRGEETSIGFKRLAERGGNPVAVATTARVEHGERRTPRPPGTPLSGFGGLNVILAGDFWQLAPPRGTFLGAVPAQLPRSHGVNTKLPHAAYGQQLIWGGPKNGIQGVAELVACERAQDEWLRQVQEEFRHGTLSASTHAFLHGRPTDVTGSWQGARSLWRRKLRQAARGTRRP